MGPKARRIAILERQVDDLQRLLKESQGSLMQMTWDMQDAYAKGRMVSAAENKEGIDEYAKIVADYRAAAVADIKAARAKLETGVEWLTIYRSDMKVYYYVRGDAAYDNALEALKAMMRKLIRDGQ